MRNLRFFRHANVVCFALLHILVQDEPSSRGRGMMQPRSLSEFVSSIFPSSYGNMFADEDDLLPEDGFSSDDDAGTCVPKCGGSRSCGSMGSESCARGSCFRGGFPGSGVPADDSSDDGKSCPGSASCGGSFCKGVGDMAAGMTGGVADFSAEQSLKSEMESAMPSEMESAMESAMASEMESAMESEMKNAMESEMKNAMESAMASEMESAMENTVEDAVEETLGDDAEETMSDDVEEMLDDGSDETLEDSVAEALDDYLDDDDMEETVDDSLDDGVEDAVEDALDGTAEDILGDHVEDDMLSPDEDFVEEDSPDLMDDASDELLIDLEFSDPNDLDGRINRPYDHVNVKVTQTAGKWDSLGPNPFLFNNNSCPYGCRNSDLSKTLTEEQLDEKIYNLGSVVDVRDMYIIWNYVNDNEKKKFYSMRTMLLTYCDCLSDACEIPHEIKKQEWLKVHRFMNRVFLRYEKRFTKYIHSFLKHGKTDRWRFIDFLNNYKAKCNKFRIVMYNYWKNNIFTRIDTYQRFLVDVS
ncbi:phist protein (Pf-fam-b) [Plasmodium vivax North Korean]|uniref:Phist protein (Pf-fam-b) n=1 Tax=Plasmodium vivax North Korean TaxID=1035514 RepID=A0A0J9TXU8_PLAVI|nr:phist protein (Pf-fam-b) [Plasmodium vivax North Korean]